MGRVLEVSSSHHASNVDPYSAVQGTLSIAQDREASKYQTITWPTNSCLLDVYQRDSVPHQAERLRCLDANFNDWLARLGFSL